MTNEHPLLALARFGEKCLDAHREELASLGGDWLQEAAVECGLLKEVEVTEACDPENCRCAEYGDFPQTCYKLTEKAYLIEPHASEPCEQLPTKRVWIASKGTEKALTLLEADGWEVHEVVKAPVFRPNSPEDIRQSMDLLQKIHRESASLDASSGDTSVALDGGPICEDCPPLGYPTDKTRCDECPRHSERT